MRMRSAMLRVLSPAVAGALVLATGLVTPAQADDREVVKHGTCGASTWKLEAEDEGRMIEVEFELDTPKSGVDWRVVMRHDGDVFVRTIATTDHHGEIDVERAARDRAGTDRFYVRAVNLVNGHECSAGLTI